MDAHQNRPATSPTRSSRPVTPLRWWRVWWRNLSPTRQDRFAAIAPLIAVLLFLSAIATAFWYLGTEEAEREREALRRDVEYTQQRLRLRLMERQEQLMRVARDMAPTPLTANEFSARADVLISQYPELQAITWVDPQMHIAASQAAPTLSSQQLRIQGEVLQDPATVQAFSIARNSKQPYFLQSPAQTKEPAPLLQLHVPMVVVGVFVGMLVI
jgi:hypothetical protein